MDYNPPSLVIRYPQLGKEGNGRNGSSVYGTITRSTISSRNTARLPVNRLITPGQNPDYASLNRDRGYAMQEGDYSSIPRGDQAASRMSNSQQSEML